MKASGTSLESKLKEAHQDFVQIEMLVVKKAYQNQGYMRKLVQIAFDRADALGVPCIVSTDGILKMKKYEHIGFEHVQDRKFKEKVYEHDLIRYPKRKIFSKEIFPTELEKIIVTNSGTVLQFKNHSKPIAAKNKLNPLLDDLSCLIKNQISYEDTTQETCGYPENQISELLHRTKSHTETIANKILANYLGKEYAVHIEIVGEPLYSMLVFRLKKEEQVLYQHPSYEKIEKLGVDTALDAMDLTFLIKWDASCKQGLYGITQEVENQKELEAYIVSLIEDKFA